MTERRKKDNNYLNKTKICSNPNCLIKTPQLIHNFSKGQPYCKACRQRYLGIIKENNKLTPLQQSWEEILESENLGLNGTDDCIYVDKAAYMYWKNPNKANIKLEFYRQLGLFINSDEYFPKDKEEKLFAFLLAEGKTKREIIEQLQLVESHYRYLRHKLMISFRKYLKKSINPQY